MKNPPAKLVELDDGSGDWVLEFDPDFLLEKIGRAHV